MNRQYCDWAFDYIKQHRNKLTKQQFKTLVGQVNAGDWSGAIRGLHSILKRVEG